MAKMIVDSIRRTGTATSPIRQIVVVQGEGKTAVERVLSTAIEKLSWGNEFRHGGAHTPIEQYAFRVNGKVYERFADAAAVILKRHNVELSDLEGAQAYVKKAFAIIRGEDQLRVVTELPSGAAPAVVVREAIAA